MQDLISVFNQTFGVRLAEFLILVGNYFFFKLLPALIVAWIGTWVAGMLGKFVAEVIKALKFDKVFQERGWGEASKKAGLNATPSEFIGAIVQWIFVVIFLVIVADILALPAFSALLNSIIGYLPNVVAAALMFVVTVIITDLIEKIVVVSIGGMKVSYATAVGSIVKWALWIFASFAIMTQLGIAEDLVLALFQGIVQFFVIALGLAFGLGGKEVAAGILSSVKDKFKK